MPLLNETKNEQPAPAPTGPRVLNRHACGGRIPDGAVYVGRPTKWGNLWSHLPETQARYRVATRDEAVDAYEAWITRAIERDPAALDRLRDELRGKDLVCWCAPHRCHAEVLLRLANG